MPSERPRLQEANGAVSRLCQLPDELLESILECLPSIFDRLRFGAVCKSWRSIASSKCQFLPRQLPLLMLPGNDCSSTRDFYSLTERKVISIDIPQIHKKRCCGSSKGWLTTLEGNSKEIQLINPFSGGRIELPSLDTFSEIQYPGDPDMRDSYYVVKAIISSSPIANPQGFVVMTIVGHLLKLTFCRPGDKKWTTIQSPLAVLIQDVIYYKQKFYGVEWNEGIVIACDMDSQPPTVTEITPPWLRHQAYPIRKYLVESREELLMVIRYVDYNPSCTTTHFEAFKLDESTQRWIKLKSLGDQMLFLGLNCSVSVSSSDFPQGQRNSIYFTDDYMYGNPSTYHYRDAGVFNMEDGNIRSYYKNPPICVTPTIWVTPKP